VRLLFDQNISYRILKKLSDQFEGSIQVRTAGLEDTSDRQIWDYAKGQKLTIVTFDSDFSDIATVRGHPPKIIWLRLQDTSTKNIVRIMSEKLNVIVDFVSNPAYDSIACLELNDIDVV